MPSFSSPEWDVDYPEGWIAEKDEESVVFYQRDAELGTVQVTCFCQDEPVEAEDLLEFAGELIAAGKRQMTVEIGGKKGVMFRYYTGDEAWKEWYLAAGNCLFFVTYDCPRAVEGVEDDDVAAIIESLHVRGTV